MARRPTVETPSMDARGLLRFPLTMMEQLALEPYASVFVDAVGQRIALALATRPQPGSFRIISPGGRPALYLRSAFLAAHIAIGKQPLLLGYEGKLLIVSPRKNDLAGDWQPFHCRSSADIPMVTLDRRGTLVLDRLCVRELSSNGISSVEAQYDSSTGTFALIFSSQGSLAVRRAGSHAEISFRGILSTHGLPMPARSLRYPAQLQGGTLRFSLREPFLQARPER